MREAEGPTAGGQSSLLPRSQDRSAARVPLTRKEWRGQQSICLPFPHLNAFHRIRHRTDRGIEVDHTLVLGSSKVRHFYEIFFFNFSRTRDLVPTEKKATRFHRAAFCRPLNRCAHTQQPLWIINVSCISSTAGPSGLITPLTTLTPLICQTP